mgnify:CR=1 FL=1
MHIHFNTNQTTLSLELACALPLVNEFFPSLEIRERARRVSSKSDLFASGKRQLIDAVVEQSMLIYFWRKSVSFSTMKGEQVGLLPLC